MAITKEDLRDFTRFADERLHNGGADSLVALAGEWESLHQKGEIGVVDLPPLDLDIDEETLRALAAAFPDVDDPEKLRRAASRRGGLTTAQMLAKAAAVAEQAGRQ